MFDNEASPSTGIVARSDIGEIISRRDAALATITRAADTLQAGYTLAGEAVEIAKGAHMGRGFRFLDRSETNSYQALFVNGFDAARSVEQYRRQLDAAIWTHLLDLTGIRTMMDVDAVKAFEADLLGDVTEVSESTVRATFETLCRDADMIFKRGMANAFSRLDRRFRSHDVFMFKHRIIITNAFTEWGSLNWHGGIRETITDVERVFAVLDGNDPNADGLMHAIDESRGRGMNPRQSECESRYFRIKGFKNGNAHLWFSRKDLVEKVNKALAEYYGDVLPDAAEADEAPKRFRSTALVPAKDLKFYPTPEAVQDFIFHDLTIRTDDRVLEPSAGTGNLVRCLKTKGARVTAIEVHPDRVSQLRRLEDESCEVIEANFLSHPARPIFDAVVMNPPFYGTHWMDHVRHAFDFLKPGGRLVSVLPASAELAETPKHVAFRRWAEKEGAPRWGRMFRDLPAESFAACGTRINTVIITLHRGNT